MSEIFTSEFRQLMIKIGLGIVIVGLFFYAFLFYMKLQFYHEFDFVSFFLLLLLFNYILMTFYQILKKNPTYLFISLIGFPNSGKTGVPFSSV